jgi:hypothetical protein
MLDEQIEEFWEWWSGVKDEFLNDIATESETHVPAEITTRLSRLHAELSWQLTPGVAARHSLNVASGGSRLLRLITGRWAMFAPESDSDWEYRPARLPFVADVLDVRGVGVDPNELKIGMSPDTVFERMDFVVSHPAFADLDYEEARDATLEFFDSALGEDEVERWMGMLEIVPGVLHSVALDGLAAAVTGAVTAFSGKSWEDGSEYYEGDVVASINRSAKWIDNLHRPLYSEVTMASLASDDRGLPTPLEARRLDEISKQLLDRFGDDAVLLATATGDGERTLYFYLAPKESVDVALAEWKATNSNREISVEITPDEQWANAEQWD